MTIRTEILKPGNCKNTYINSSNIKQTMERNSKSNRYCKNINQTRIQGIKQ